MACHRGFVLTAEARKRLPMARWREAGSLLPRRLALITVHPGKERLIDLPRVKRRWMDSKNASPPPTSTDAIPVPSIFNLFISFSHHLSLCFHLVSLHWCIFSLFEVYLGLICCRCFGVIIYWNFVVCFFFLSNLWVSTSDALNMLHCTISEEVTFLSCDRDSFQILRSASNKMCRESAKKF